MDSTVELLIASAAGVLCHNLAFIHGEWHMHATSLLKLPVASFAAVAFFEAACQGLPLASALAASGVICSTYLICLFASMIVYRMLFHRLRHFPGPVLAKVSKLWHVMHCLDSKNHLLLERLHQEYGDFVRTGARFPKNLDQLYKT